MSKIKVLFVVAGFYRAGAERFAYEIDKALDKENFELTIFCLERENKMNPLWENRYYENLHKEQGTQIKYVDQYAPHKYVEVIYRLRQYLNLYPEKINYWNNRLDDFMNQFDVIHWMGEYIYINTIADNIRDKSLIHMMTARFQKRDLYDNFNHNSFYNFCTPFKASELKYELEQFKDYHSVFVPLVLEIDKEKKKWEFRDSSIKKIGIFTRLDRLKPLDPFFYSFHLLLDKMPNCELHIYGNGDPEKEGMNAFLDRIGIKDKVFFRGHQEDIVQTAIDEKLSLSWFQGYNNDRPAGYAGIDICTTGTPLLCWDFHPYPNDFYNPIYPHYKNLNKFVEKTIEILTEKENAEELSEWQYQDVVDNRNVYDYISIIENEYIRIAQQRSPK
jgi:glycosyltransferase involved in cell wall biosynthesis